MSKRIAFLTAAEGVEEVELTKPWKAAVDAGHTAELLSLDEGEVQLFHHLDKSTPSGSTAGSATSPSPTTTRSSCPAASPTPTPSAPTRPPSRSSATSSTPASPSPRSATPPWTLVEADRVQGKRVASWPSLQTDIRNGGGEWVDEEVVVDGNLITSRNPDDLPAFSKALLDALGS